MIKKLYALLFLFIYCCNAFAASDKLLDGFTSTVNYYTAATPGGSGSITKNIDNSVFKEGNSSLRIDYSLNAAASNYVEVYRNYGAQSTLDLSFMPDYLSLWVKGKAGNGDVFKFMLYEDHNMNGNPFDTDDEIYVYTNTTVLNSDNWTLVEMPYSAFVKFGGGTGTLDLNRIGVWRIVIENGNATTHSNTVYVDDLRQHTTYDPIPVGTPKLTGSFIQLWNDGGCKCGQWSQTQWNDQMQKMTDVCMNTFIVQYSVYGDNAWYTPSSLAYVTYKNQTLDRIFQAAKANNIKIYLGLYFDNDWNTFDKSVAGNYTSLLQKQKDVIDELYTLFGANSVLEGWYIPQEINDLEWQSDVNRNLLANYLQGVAAYAKSKDASKKVMIAPFFGPFRPADDLELWYNKVLEVATDIDMVYPQDGVGTGTKTVDVDIPYYFKAIKNACEAKGRIFGATVESFLQTDDVSFTANPTPFPNFKIQLQESGKLTNNLITFEWGYMQPGLTTQTQQLYDDYKAYANCTTTAIEVKEGERENMMFYPVPARSGQTITIRAEGMKEDGELSITNLMGQKLFSASYVNKGSMELKLPENLSRGTYLIVIRSTSEVRAKRILIE